MNPDRPSGIPNGDGPPGHRDTEAEPVRQRSGLVERLGKAFKALNLFAQYRRLGGAEEQLHQLEQLALRLEQTQETSGASFSRAITSVQGEIEQLRDSRLPHAEQRLDQIEQDLRAAQQEAGRLRELHTRDAERFDHLEEALRSAGGEVERLRDVVLPATLQRGDVLVDRLVEELDEQASLLERLLRREPLPAPAVGAGERRLAETFAALQPALADALAVVTEGSATAYRLEHLLAMLRERPPVLDLAAGRGEMLQLLGEAGVAARGVESDSARAQAARRRGLPLVDGQLPEVLQQLDDASYGSVLARHILDLLPTGNLLRVLQEVARLLEPGGVLLVESLNPAALRLAAGPLWNDPRRRPLPVTTLRRYLQASGFAIEETQLLDPAPEEERFLPGEVQPPSSDTQQETHQEMRRLQQRLDELLNGPQTVLIRAVKPGGEYEDE